MESAYIERQLLQLSVVPSLSLIVFQLSLTRSPQSPSCWSLMLASGLYRSGPSSAMLHHSRSLTAPRSGRNRQRPMFHVWRSCPRQHKVRNSEIFSSTEADTLQEFTSSPHLRSFNASVESLSTPLSPLDLSTTTTIHYNSKVHWHSWKALQKDISSHRSM